MRDIHHLIERWIFRDGYTVPILNDIKWKLNESSRYVVHIYVYAYTYHTYIHIYIYLWIYLFIWEEDTKNRKNIAGTLNCNVIIAFARVVILSIALRSRIDRNERYFELILTITIKSIKIDRISLIIFDFSNPVM